MASQDALPAPLAAELARLGVIPRPAPRLAPAPRPAPTDNGWYRRGEDCPF